MAVNFWQKTATDEYKRLVLEDLKTYERLNHPQKTGVVKRLVTRKLPIMQLHPNPDDEFSDPTIGPNYSIVSDYQQYFQSMMRMSQDPFNEPLMVEKMSTGGYMILNGHHRWMAARRVGIKKVPVHIVNVSTDAEIIEAVKKSDRSMCASFDLDEILLTDGETYPAHKEFGFPLNRIFKKYLRRNAPVLINELRRMGFDVWVYTGEYYPEAYLNGLFKAHGTEIDGIVSGMRTRKGRSGIREAFSQKYRISLHVDNEEVTCVKPREKDFESFAIDAANEDWASEVVERLRENKEYWHG